MPSLPSIYRHLPGFLQPVAEQSYAVLQRFRTSERERRRFRERLFDDGEYEQYVREYETSEIWNLRTSAREEFSSTVDANTFGDIRRIVARDLFALIRAKEPKVVVETGVCNGYSTLVLLEAIDRNDHGELFSVDYPFYAERSLSEFREETFDEYGGAAIPSNKEPGWIVPTDLQDDWTLRLGRSQRELPKLVTELPEIDMFVHDSEHSLPCMLFEFELAWEWLSEGGLLVADDVSWNDAFESFVAERNADHGYLAPDVGYLVR